MDYSMTNPKIGTLDRMTFGAVLTLSLESGFFAIFMTIFQQEKSPFFSLSFLLMSILFGLGYILVQNILNFHVYFFLSILPVLSVFYLWQYPLWIIMLSFLFFYLRFMKHLENRTEDFEVDEGLILFLLFVSILFLCLNGIWFHNGTTVLLIIVMEFSGYFFGTYWIRYLSRRKEGNVKGSRSTKRMKEHFPAFLFILGLLWILFAGFLFLSSLRSLFSLILKGIFIGISPIIEPIMSFLQSLINEENQSDLKLPSRTTTKESGEELAQSTEGSIVSNLNVGWLDELFYLLFALMIIGSFIRMMKKKYTSDNQHAAIGMVNIREGNGRKDNHKQSSAENVIYSKAHHDIRKEMEKLEKTAHKLKKERRPNESIREWMSRYDIHQEEWIGIYEEVRYGHRPLNLKQVAMFRQITKEVLAQLKGK
ncbi:hypothetical protein [Bacillus sp. 2205SS5-2]|uniref:hypothetical protein n=1 Tax=Bacillus sp. 2205SS5-2 TaxID=3109031 RepID=UPI003006094D